jgi:hypothetical protein
VISQRGASSARKNLKELRNHNPEFDLSRFISGTLTSLRTDTFKYLHSEEDDHRLLKLPDESADESYEYPSTAKELKSILETWLDTDGEPFESERQKGEMTEEREAQLRGLGYL